MLLSHAGSPGSRSCKRDANKSRHMPKVRFKSDCWLRLVCLVMKQWCCADVDVQPVDTSQSQYHPQDPPFGTSHVGMSAVFLLSTALPFDFQGARFINQLLSQSLRSLRLQPKLTDAGRTPAILLHSDDQKQSAVYVTEAVSYQFITIGLSRCVWNVQVTCLQSLHQKAANETHHVYA